MKPRLLLRADGNERIGLGHVSRLVSFFHLVKMDFSCQFAIQRPSQAVRKFVEDEGILVCELLADSEEKELAELASLIKLLDVKLVVLDGYTFKTAYQERLREAGPKLVVVDDLRAWPMQADVVINHAPGVTAAMYEATASTRFFLGPAYSLVRQPFMRAFARPARPIKIEKVLICFGGADPLNLTVRLLGALGGVAEITHIGVLTGSAFTDFESLGSALSACARHCKVRHYTQLGAAELVGVLQWYDAVICPASTILIESLLLGRAALTGYFADNQRYLADYTSAHQQAYSLGNLTTLAPLDLPAVLAAGISWLASRPRAPYTAQLLHQELSDVLRALV